MINIQVFTGNMLQENCYVVYDESKECVIIDCGLHSNQEQNTLIGYVAEHQLQPVHLIATHGHLDHHLGDAAIFREYGLLAEVHHRDEYLMKSLPEQAQSFFNITLEKGFPDVGRYLCESDVISFGTHALHIIETPGHTPGSIVFYCKEENVAFTGDTLFKQSIGRTDLPGGSMFEMIQSLRILCQLPDETVVLSGHGPKTTIGVELASNPYLDR